MQLLRAGGRRPLGEVRDPAKIDRAERVPVPEWARRHQRVRRAARTMTALGGD